MGFLCFAYLHRAANSRILVFYIRLLCCHIHKLVYIRADIDFGVKYGGENVATPPGNPEAGDGEGYPVASCPTSLLILLDKILLGVRLFRKAWLLYL